jgi:hypothetical protein
VQNSRPLLAFPNSEASAQGFLLSMRTNLSGYVAPVTIPSGKSLLARRGFLAAKYGFSG